MTDAVRLPKGWATAMLPELVARDGILADGDWVESKDQDPNGNVRLIQLADIGDGTFRDRSSRFMTREKAAELGCTYLEKDDIMIARMPDPLGRTCLFPGSKLPCVTVVDVCIVRPGTDSISNRWLMHAINSPAFRVSISQLQSGSTRKRISKKNLLTIPLPVPPTNEQRQIAEAIESYLTRLDAAVALLERVQRNLKRYRASVLKAAVEGRLVPTEAELARKEGRSYEPASELLKRILVERRKKWIEDAAEKARAKAEKKAREMGKCWTHEDNIKTLEKERAKAAKKYKEPTAPDLSALRAQAGTTNLPDLPEGWCWATCDQLGEPGEQVVLTGPFGSALKSSEFVHDGVPVLTIGCLTEHGIDLAKANYVTKDVAQDLSRYVVRDGDILFSRMATVGRAGLVERQIAARGSLINYHLMRLRLAGKVILAQYFIAFVRGSASITNYVRGINHGMTRDGINTKQLLAMPVALPPLGEQDRIAAEVDRVLSLVGAMSATTESTAYRCLKLRQSILKWAFEGKLVEQDPNDLPAPRPGNWFVYALECDDGSIYIGQTENIEERWKLHARGKGAEWTKRHPPVKLVHWEEFDSLEDAVKREKQLKTGFGRKWLKREYAAGRTRQAGEPASVLLERIKAKRESMQPRKRRRTIRKKKGEQLDLLGGSNR